MPAVPQSTDVVLISRAPLAITNPAVTGISPACTSLRQMASRDRCHSLKAANVSTEDGPATPSVVTSAPGSAATHQPISVTTSIFGPGAACASANSEANSCALIQPCTSTAWRCISGSNELVPPNASSDSCANTAARLATVAAPLMGERPTLTEWRQRP